GWTPSVLSKAHGAADLVTNPQSLFFVRTDPVGSLGHDVLETEQWLKWRSQCLPAAFAQIGPRTSWGRMQVAALRAPFGRGRGDMVAFAALDGEDDLRDSIPGSFVIDDRPGPELLDCEEARS